MATEHPLPVPPIVPPQAAEAVASNEAGGEQALVPSPSQHVEGDSTALSPSVARLPVELDVEVPVREFRVRNLLALEPGQLIESQWVNGDDLPLASGDVQLAWSEFEVIDTLLAVRVTRLA